MQPGQFIKRDDKQRYTLGVVYEPDTVDSQGDFSTAEEIEKGCWNFMRKLQGRTGVTKTALTLLESVVKALDEGKPITLDITDIYEGIAKGEGLNDMHVNTPFDNELGNIVENYIAPVDFEIDGESIKKGSWLMGTVWSSDYFSKILDGKRNGYSMEGRGKRVDANG